MAISSKPSMVSGLVTQAHAMQESADISSEVASVSQEPFPTQVARDAVFYEIHCVRSLCIGAILGLEGLAAVFKEKYEADVIDRAEAIGTFAEISSFVFNEWPNSVLYDKADSLLTELNKVTSETQETAQAIQILERLESRIEASLRSRFLAEGARKLGFDEVAFFVEHEPEIFNKVFREWRRNQNELMVDHRLKRTA